MPTRNVVKVYCAGGYYHVYNRGVDKMDIFRDEQDFRYFIYLLRRALGTEKMRDDSGREYKNFSELVELCAYCLMPNHFHMLLYLKEDEGITSLMRSVMTSYSGYFNAKYRRKGPLFQNTFLASHVTREAYFWHITRYIHLNPADIGEDWRTYEFSSIKSFTGEATETWLHPEHFVETAEERRQYEKFVDDYLDMHTTLSVIKKQLADAS